MLPKGIIFDLDDTLISLKCTANDTWKIICEEYSSENNTIDSKVLYEKITEVRLSYWEDSKSNDRGRKNQKEARREIISMVFEQLDLPKADIFAVADTYSERRLGALKLFPMVYETLRELKERGVKLALITNGEAKIQRYKIEKFDLQRYFDCILIETEVGFGKPDTRIFERAMGEMQVNPKQVWSVGDNLIWDIEAPQKLGIYSIWNDFEKIGVLEDSKILPDRIINSVYELIE